MSTPVFLHYLPVQSYKPMQLAFWLANSVSGDVDTWCLCRMLWALRVCPPCRQAQYQALALPSAPAWPPSRECQVQEPIPQGPQLVCLCPTLEFAGSDLARPAALRLPYMCCGCPGQSSCCTTMQHDHQTSLRVVSRCSLHLQH